MARPRKNSQGQTFDEKKGKYRTGRPSKLTPETIIRLEEAFKMGCGDIEACLFADISSSSFYSYQQANPKFLERKNELKQNPILKARAEVIRGIQGNPEFSLKVLERIKKDEFSLKQDTLLNAETVKIIIQGEDSGL